MNQEIKAQWVAALRSGEYKQGTRVLHNRGEGTYCCLGVLCDLAIKAGVDVMQNDTTVEFHSTTTVQIPAVYFDNEAQVLPMSVSEWSGAPGEDPTPTEDGASLASLNDAGHTFEEIALIIENNL